MSEKAWVARDAKDGSRLLFTDEPTVDDKGSFDSIENWCSLLWAENLAAPPDYIAGILPTDLKPGECREIENALAGRHVCRCSGSERGAWERRDMSERL